MTDQPRKRITIEPPTAATVLAARHLDATECRAVDTATRSAITTVLRYIAKAHNAPPAAEQRCQRNPVSLVEGPQTVSHNANELTASTPLICSDERHAAKVAALEHRLRLAHQARRAKEHQLDGIRRALCDAGFMQDDDPYSHADLEDVIRQAAPTGAGDQLAATLNRVRNAVHIADDEDATDWQRGFRACANRVVSELDEQPDGHVYLSTGCLHGDHHYCKNMTGLNGAKRPGECKHCGAKCTCGCHEETP